MAEIGWTKTAEAPKPHRAISGERLKYLIGGGALLEGFGAGAVAMAQPARGD